MARLRKYFVGRNTYGAHSAGTLQEAAKGTIIRADNFVNEAGIVGPHQTKQRGFGTQEKDKVKKCTDTPCPSNNKRMWSNAVKSIAQP